MASPTPVPLMRSMLVPEKSTEKSIFYVSNFLSFLFLQIVALPVILYVKPVRPPDAIVFISSSVPRSFAIPTP